MPQPADIRRKQASILFGCLSALLMLGCLVIGTWLLFDFVNRTDHVKIKYISKLFFFYGEYFRHGVVHVVFVLNQWTRMPDNRVFFDHGGLTAFDDGKNQLLKPALAPNAQQEFQQEVSRIFL